MAKPQTAFVALVGIVFLAVMGIIIGAQDLIWPWVANTVVIVSSGMAVLLFLTVAAMLFSDNTRRPPPLP